LEGLSDEPKQLYTSTVKNEDNTNLDITSHQTDILLSIEEDPDEVIPAQFEKLPTWKAVLLVCYAVGLLVAGTNFLVTGDLTLIILGYLLVIAAAYLPLLCAYKAWKGEPGYGFDEFPECVICHIGST
jgi:hypothetical protein